MGVLNSTPMGMLNSTHIWGCWVQPLWGVEFNSYVVLNSTLIWGCWIQVKVKWNGSSKLKRSG